MLDPLQRWREFGEKPDYAGLLTWGGVPYTEDPAQLAGADAVVIGAPMDDLVSDRPGARLGPRAIRMASCPHGPLLPDGPDALDVLRVVDYGDAAVLPALPERSHQAIQTIVADAAGAGAIPLVLGGDHSISLPAIRALAAQHGPVGCVHFDAHTDTGEEVFGARLSHGTIFRTLIDEGALDPARYVQIGLRGYWPGPEVFAWQRERGVVSIFAREIEELTDAAVLARIAEQVGDGPTYISVDVDVCEPSEIGWSTGTPEPGGMRSGRLLALTQAVAAASRVVGCDVVEVLPTRIGSHDGAALVADRVLRAILTGVAQRRAA